MYAVDIHRKEQFDLKCIPYMCINVCIENARLHTCRRIFCIWDKGVQLGKHVLLWHKFTAHLRRLANAWKTL